MDRVSGKLTIYFEDPLQFSPAVETVVKDTKKNPKRVQRDAKKRHWRRA